MVEGSFWQGKKVLVTGHTGFKGSWLCLWLSNLKANVVGYALAPPTQPNMFDDAKVVEDITNISGDVRDIETLSEAIAKHQPEIVFHLAAQSLVLESYEAAEETFSTNIMGSVNLLQALNDIGCAQAIVIITSDKCYDQATHRPAYVETDPLGGVDPYSASKASSELVASAYRQSFFSSPETAWVATARSGNVIGGGDWASHRLVPDMIRAFMSGTAAEIRNPSYIRPWQHVLEPLNGYLMLAQRLFEDQGEDFAEAWNFGPDSDDCKPVSWIADQVCKHWETGIWHHKNIENGVEAERLVLDSAKARERLGWASWLPIEDTLKLTIDWYQGVVTGSDLRSLTIKQIEHFEELMPTPSLR